MSKKYDFPVCCRSDDRYYSIAGDRVIDKFALDFPDRGGLALKKIGEKPIYELIQSERANCDLQAVLESCVHSNQYSVLGQDSLNDLVCDFTTCTNLGELYAGTKRIENAFYDLPIEVRENFDSDLKKFVRAIGTDDFNNLVSDGYNRFFGRYHDNINASDVVDTPDNPVLGGTTVSDSILDNSDNFESEVK